MISGACLLGKRDSYAKTGRRILRTVLALVLASYLYFLWDAWVNYGLWPRAVDFGALFRQDLAGRDNGRVLGIRRSIWARR